MPRMSAGVHTLWPTVHATVREGESPGPTALVQAGIHGDEVAGVHALQELLEEGLAPERGRLSVMQDAFCEKHALQCGYCTPGMLIACSALTAQHPHPTEAQIREAISGNLCRCTGYQQIVEAVLYATRTADTAQGESHSHD